MRILLKEVSFLFVLEEEKNLKKCKGKGGKASRSLAKRYYSSLPLQWGKKKKKKGFIDTVDYWGVQRIITLWNWEKTTY